MGLNSKISILIILFGIKAFLHFLDGAIIISNGGSYGDYGDAFATAAIMGYVAYAIYSTKNRWTYWLAIFFAGLVLIRFVMAMVLQLYSGELPTRLIIFALLNGILFGVVPLVLLLDKEVRGLFKK